MGEEGGGSLKGRGWWWGGGEEVVGGKGSPSRAPNAEPPASNKQPSTCDCKRRFQVASPPPPAIPSRARRACAREQTIPADIKGSMLMTRHKSSERATEPREDRRSFLSPNRVRSDWTCAPPFAGCSIIQRQWTHPPSFAMDAFRTAPTHNRVWMCDTQLTGRRPLQGEC